MTKQILFCLLLTFGLSISSYAQSENNPWNFGVSAGKMEYNGDKGSNIFGSPFQGHGGARIGRYLNRSFDLVLAGSRGRHGIFESEVEGL